MNAAALCCTRPAVSRVGGGEQTGAVRTTCRAHYRWAWPRAYTPASADATQHLPHTATGTHSSLSTSISSSKQAGRRTTACTHDALVCYLRLLPVVHISAALQRAAAAGDRSKPGQQTIARCAIAGSHQRHAGRVRCWAWCRAPVVRPTRGAAASMWQKATVQPCGPLRPGGRLHVLRGTCLCRRTPRRRSPQRQPAPAARGRHLAAAGAAGAAGELLKTPASVRDSSAASVQAAQALQALTSTAAGDAHGATAA